MPLLILLAIYLIFGPTILIIMLYNKQNILESKIKFLEQEIKRFKNNAHYTESETIDKVVIRDQVLSEEMMNSTNQSDQKHMTESTAPISSENSVDSSADLKQKIVASSIPQVAVNTNFETEKQYQTQNQARADFNTSSQKSFDESAKKTAPKPKKDNTKRSSEGFFTKLTKFEFNLESIIGKLGALLLLIGIAYVYKLAYDNGYISEIVTILLGYVIATLIFFLGNYFVRKKRQILAQILIGTAFAVAYITTYSGYLHYEIFGDFTAFLILIIINILIFAVSYLYNFQTVATFASVCSMLVPFLIDADFIGVNGIGIYLVSLSTVSMIIYYIKKWDFLQIVTNLSVLISLMIMLTSFTLPEDQLLKFSILVMVLSLISALPDLISNAVRNLEKTMFTKIKEPIIQLANFIMSILFIVIIDYFRDNSLAYILFAYSTCYAVAIYASYRKHGFKILEQTLYAMATSSVILGVCILFDTMHLGLWLLAISVPMILLDKFIKKAISSIIGYGIYYASFIVILVDTWDESAMSLGIILAGSLALITITSIICRKAHKPILRVISYIGYVLVFANLSVIILNKEVLPDLQIDILFTQMLILNIALFTVYYLAHLFLHVFSTKTLSITLLCITVFELLILLPAAFVYIDTPDFYYNELIKTLSVIDLVAMVLSIGVIYILSTKVTDKFGKRSYFLSMIILSQIFALYQVSYFFENITYGLCLASLIILALDIAYRKWLGKNQTYLPLKSLIKYTKIFSMVVSAIYFIFVYPIFCFTSESINFLELLANSIVMKIMFHNLKIVKMRKEIRYAISCIMIVYLSYVHIYLPTGFNHYLSLIWATYTIAMFIYYLRKSDVRMVNINMVLLIIIVCKFILIDLSSASLISKVITSIAFGIALITLSYMVPRLMKKPDKE